MENYSCLRIHTFTMDELVGHPLFTGFVGENIGGNEKMTEKTNNLKIEHKQIKREGEDAQNLSG